MKRLLILALLTLNAVAEEAPPYGAAIRPILSDNCFRCHGPDAAERQADLRLDQPGFQDWPELLARITSQDPDEVMPPPESNKSLESNEITLLKKWMASGAPYEKHWAFIPPEKSPQHEEGHPIDHFVGEERPIGNPADVYTLVRRVYLDLIGLPPTPQEADAFAAEISEEAYIQLVDSLLESPHYGERWTRRWLDLARYADTNGYEKDRDRTMWPYRDWVINAINAGMPFDQFTIEQLAGDLLSNPTPDQLVATGFHRNTMLNEEGGIDPLEFRYHAMTDRVATTGTTFLGLTLGCAQCHTHKYDPITHDEYFQIFAYLNNADEPDYLIPDADKEAEHRQRMAKAAERLRELPNKWPTDAGTLEEKRTAWLIKRQKEAVTWRILEPGDMKTNLPLLTHEGEGIILSSGDTSKHDVYEISFPLRPFSEPIRSIRLEALPDDRLPARGPGLTFYEGTKGDFYLTEFLAEIDGNPIKLARGMESYAKNRFGNQPVSAQLALDGDLQTGWSVHGRLGERHVAVFLLKDPIKGSESLKLTMHFGRHYASSLGKFRVSVGDQAPPKVSPLSAAHEKALAEGRERAHLEELHQAFLLHTPELKKPAKEILELQKPPALTAALIMRERPAHHPRPTYLHHRGEFLSPRHEVQPNLPEALWPTDKLPPKNRLEFARWLVSLENPLTARVVVNRHWAAFFGEGLVKTLDDFGMQGSLPSNQALLDWLAVEFMESGWSLKALHKLIVTSRFYRQAALPSFRLEAEIIRDSALKAAGLLSNKMFGPPVRPPQPEGVTEVAYGGYKWSSSEGEDRYRRSIYTYQKRTAPFAMFGTFDAPSGEACVARRDVSNTPLQALTLVNDPMMLEIDQALGSEIANTNRNEAWKLRQIFRRVLTRHPTLSELEKLRGFLASQRQGLTDGSLNAAEIAGDENASPDEAAWTALGRALFGLHETITRN